MFSDFRSFALCCTFLRRFELVLHFFALVWLMTLPTLAPVKDTELDFCFECEKMLESNCRGKTLQGVNLCIEPGGRHKFCYDGGSRLLWLGARWVGGTFRPLTSNKVAPCVQSL